jgi:hypothetical protein
MWGLTDSRIRAAGQAFLAEAGYNETLPLSVNPHSEPLIKESYTISPILLRGLSEGLDRPGTG